ncbi:alpha-ketoglutarate-dependent dioxygenase AlkB [Pseudomonas fulva]|uniref:alpha-ketoglutarate-dependent dioxygenase AlkB n=2 Tax=Pseudomonas TaxID=286 RepID=UPI00380F3BCD
MRTTEKQTRTFALKHRSTGQRCDLPLRHGQVAIMRGETQRFWLHSVLKTNGSVSPRINLTFRSFPEG